MKVLVVTGHYPPPYTANAVRAYHLVKALIERGYKVTVLQLLSSKSGERQGFFGERVVMPFSGLDETVRPPLHRRALDLLRKKLATKKIKIGEVYDVVIATLPPLEAIPLGRRISKELNAKLVCDVQDLSDEWKILERPYMRLLVKALFRSVYAALKDADAILATTEFMRDIIVQRTGNDRVYVIPNGADVEFFNEAYLRRREAKRRNKEPLRAVFLGDLNWPYHSLDSLIEALGILREHGVELRLDVIGTGRLRFSLEALARELDVSDLVTFHGYVDRAKLPELLGEADFGVVSRIAIDNLWIKATIRLTTYEYLACGLPLLAYGPPGSYTETFVKNKGVGVYIPSSDPRTIADFLLGGGLEKLLQIPPDHVRSVAEEYDWSKIMSRAASIVEEVVKA